MLGDPGVSQAVVLLEAAVERFMMQRDFSSALCACEEGLQCVCELSVQEKDDSLRFGELKTTLCIVGIQCLAELNRWHGVLAWVLHYYGPAEKMPAKVLQMCILLYSKVGESVLMQEVTRDWLNHPANESVAGFMVVAELYLLHVLLPCGDFTEAKVLLQAHFSQAQTQVALEIMKRTESSHSDSVSSNPPAEAAVPRRAAALRLVQKTLTALQRRFQSVPMQRVLIAAFLLYLLLVRLDPAMPSAFPWISSLVRMISRFWDAMFGPAHHTLPLTP